MNPAFCFEAVPRTPLVRPRLELELELEPSEIFQWDDVQRAIQDALDQLRDDVHVRDPEVVVKLAQTSGGVVELYAFGSFFIPTRASAEAIIAGVTIERTQRGHLLTADVCGEDSGHIYLRLGPRVVEGEQHLVAAAGELAAGLVRDVQVVLDAVRESREV
ncbi:MAG TPA: hypothetical protein VGM29_08045 [Polyangiaceae bacterium]|jgi:hypothetical protein